MKLQAIGVDDTIESLNSTAKQLDEMEKPMREATLLVTGSAKKNAPVDRNLLRASITPGIRQSGLAGIVGVVGSNVAYAPAMESGTKPHVVPLDELKGWAKRHGISAWLVQRSIATKGTKPRRYLQKAFNSNISRINRIFEAFVNRITK